MRELFANNTNQRNRAGLLRPRDAGVFAQQQHNDFMSVRACIQFDQSLALTEEETTSKPSVVKGPERTIHEESAKVSRRPDFFKDLEISDCCD